ncbi:outer membrane protein assembly factor BamB family protein [Actinopolymorpha pittospori]
MSRPRARYEDPDVPDEALRRAELNRRNFLRAAGIFGVSAAALGTFAGPVAASPSVPGSSKSAKAAGLAIVRGKVFRELKAITPARSKGIPGVAVSDGESIAVTDAGGRYELAVNPSRRTTGIVFVTVPSGWTAAPDADMIPTFYRKVALQPGGEANVDFGLQHDVLASNDYQFLAASDPHVHLSGGFPFDPDPVNRWRGQIGQFNEIVSGARQTPRQAEIPRFLTVAGDVTNLGVPEEFQAFRTGTRDSILPVWPALGNHDYPLAGLGIAKDPNYDAAVDLYRKNMGPEWYSFEYGNQHFVVLDNMIGIGQPDQLKWLRADLALAGLGREIVLMFHAPFAEADWWLSRYYTDLEHSIAQAFLDVLAPYNVQLMLSGHAHVNRVDRTTRQGTVQVNTNSSYYSLDNTPLGFRLMAVREGEEIKAPFRVYGVSFALTLVHPAAGARVPEGTTTAQVSTYNTTSQITSARYRVDSGPWKSMDPTGDWTWSADLDTSALGQGEHEWQVDVRDSVGRRKSSSATFEVVASNEFPSPAAGTAWSMFHGGPARGGRTPDTVAPPLRLAWSYRSEGTILNASPAIAGDTVYVGIRDENDVKACGLVALDIATGEERWRVPSDSLVEASPAVVDGRVVTTSVNGTIQTLDAATGEVVWEHRLDEGKPLLYPKVYSSPTVSDGVVVNLHEITGGTPLVQARDLATGKELWSYTATFVSVGTSNKPAAIGDGRVYFNPGTTFIALTPRALDLATGKQVWTGSPATTGEAVLAGQGPVVYSDGILLVNYVDKLSQGPNAILAFDTTSNSTPNEIWRFVGPQKVLVEANLHGTAPAVAGKVAYAGLPSGFVVALDLATGAEKWRRDLGAAVLSSPAVSGETLYVGTNGGKLYGLDTKTGEVVWQFAVSSSWVASAPAVSGNTVITGAWDGNVYAFTSESTS